MMKKKQEEVMYFINSPCVLKIVFADQRQGKDVSVCDFLEDCRKEYFEIHKCYPRVVTLGNIRIPPFVDDCDRYWSLKDLPTGTLKREVWIYTSELEAVFPARDFKSPENDLFTKLEGTFAQNHQKFIGCVKLASKVDINVIRGCNMQEFKFIDPKKLQVTGVERDNILSPLGYWLLPKVKKNKSASLIYFNNQFYTINRGLPEWWTEDYSEQFKEVPENDIWAFIDAVCDSETKPSAVITLIAQKFRNKTITKEMVQTHFK